MAVKSQSHWWSTPAEQKLLTPTTQPKALLAKAKPVEIPPQVELEQIEQDEKLQALLEKVEQGDILTGKTPSTSTPKRPVMPNY